MSEDEAIQILKECQGDDPETGHIEADKVLCDLLISLGYQEVVNEWENVRKWYS